jgi:hypothetical protein
MPKRKADLALALSTQTEEANGNDHIHQISDKPEESGHHGTEKQRPQKKRKREEDEENNGVVTWFKILNAPDFQVLQFAKVIKEHFDKQNADQVVQDKFGKMFVSVLGNDQVIQKLSKEEKDGRKRKYRSKYNARTEVIEKRRKREEDPIYIQKKKEYNNKPEVIRRKKISINTSRLVKKLLRSQDPELERKLRLEARELAERELSENRQQS